MYIAYNTERLKAIYIMARDDVYSFLFTLAEIEKWTLLYWITHSEFRIDIFFGLVIFLLVVGFIG